MKTIKINCSCFTDPFTFPSDIQMETCTSTCVYQRTCGSVYVRLLCLFAYTNLLSAEIYIRFYIFVCLNECVNLGACR